MGLWKKFFAAELEPNEVVLVPPLFERDFKGRSRFAKSGYDYAFFNVPQRLLYTYYIAQDARTMAHLTPAEDLRFSVTAKGGTSCQAGLIGTDAAGSLNFRYQPDPRDPVTFGDLKCSTQEGGGVRVRACYFDPARGWGAFAALPLVHADPARRGERLLPDGLQSSGGCQPQDLRVGLRYSTPHFAAGVTGAPASEHPGVPSSAWLVARQGPLTYGWQCSPNSDLLLPSLTRSSPRGAHPNGGLSADEAKGVAGDVVQCSSFALSYSPEGSQPDHGAFTATLELIEGRALAASLHKHLVTQRLVRNPFEQKRVVGITNYLDLGVQIVSSLDRSGARAGAPDRGSASLPARLQEPSLRAAVAWQVNKNWLLKLRAGTLEGVTAALAFKAWWQPSLTLAASVGWGPAQGGRPLLGLTAHVENYGNIRYERTNTPGKLSGGALVQRHEALPADLANAKGEGLVVRKKDLENAEILGQVAAPSARYL